MVSSIVFSEILSERARFTVAGLDPSDGGIAEGVGIAGVEKVVMMEL
jgi:hypothetical protein